MNNGRVDLHAERNAKMFLDALRECQSNMESLKYREKSFIQDMADSYDMFGQDYMPTVKQFNWLRQIAVDLAT